MSPISSFPTQRRARLEDQARLWLVWVAGALALICGARGLLDQVAKGIGALLILRVTRMLHLPARTSSIPRRTPLAAARRAMLGSCLRRLLRGKRVRARIAALLYVLRNMDRLAARMAQRLKRGLTRRRPILARGAREPCADVAEQCVLSADTS